MTQPKNCVPRGKNCAGSGSSHTDTHREGKLIEQRGHPFQGFRKFSFNMFIIISPWIDPILHQIGNLHRSREVK